MYARARERVEFNRCAGRQCVRTMRIHLCGLSTETLARAHTRTNTRAHTHTCIRYGLASIRFGWFGAAELCKKTRGVSGVFDGFRKLRTCVSGIQFVCQPPDYAKTVHSPPGGGGAGQSHAPTSNMRNYAMRARAISCSAISITYRAPANTFLPTNSRRSLTIRFICRGVVVAHTTTAQQTRHTKKPSHVFAFR